MDPLPEGWDEWPISRCLRVRRRLQGLSQKELSARAGIPRSQVSRVEAGYDARLSTLHRLGNALGLTLILAPADARGNAELPWTRRREMSDISDITLAGKSPDAVERGEAEVI